MTLTTHLHVVGALLLLLGISHAFFNRYFGWRRELNTVSLFTRQVFYVHTFFIGLGVAMVGAGSLLYADDLLQPGALNRAILGAMAIFWLCRLVAQFLVYDATIWRGNRLRTVMHAAFSALWCYITATYGIALISLCKWS